MGLSSSQARLLHLTGRMHQIEYKAAKLEAQKLQMANESAQVYNEYENALDATKIQRATLNTDGTINYVDATWTSMKDAGYDLRFEGKVVVDDATAANFDAAANSKDYFIALQTGRVTANNQDVNGVTEIYTADQLMSMIPGKNYRLMSDIDLSGKNWTSVELSTGTTFDGNGHSISGLNNSLFSTIYGTVTNLSISGNVSNLTTKKEYNYQDLSACGMLAGIASNGANINNITVSGTVDTQGSKKPTGGMIGYILNTTGTSDAVTISNCSANVVVKSGESAGGLIGGAEIPGSVVQNCSSSGTIYGAINAGGLIGFATNMTITNSSSSADVHQYGDNLNNASWWAGGRAGGFVGDAEVGTTISNCSSNGNVYSDDFLAGGFCGTVSSNPYTRISNCTSYGNVYGNQSNLITDETKLNHYAGFISTVNGGTVENCNAYGTVSVKGGSSILNNGAFAYGSDAPGAGVINNCYASDSSHAFITNPTSLSSSAGIQSSAPNNNTITVTPPTIKPTTELNDDDNNNGNLFDDIKQNGYITESEINEITSKHGNDTKWFTNMVNEGYLFIYDKDKTTGKYEQTSVATDTKLQEVSDEKELRKAEAKYEADMKRIDNKDKKFDTDLAALDNERNAIKEEMETLKTVAKDNVERTFRLFS